MLTAADNPPTRFGYAKDNTPFKGEVVRSRRDEVAGVVAIDPDTAEEALSLIKVEYEPAADRLLCRGSTGGGCPHDSCRTRKQSLSGVGL